MIPKVIHYCWFGSGQLSELEQDCIQSWRKWCPDYEIKCWSEENFDVNGYAFTKRAYQLKKFAFVSDICRLQALYQDGGIYLDTDMLLVQNLDALLKFKFFIGEQKKGVLNAAIIGAERSHIVLNQFLKEYKQLKFDTLSPIDIPTFLSSRINREEVEVFAPEYFYPLPFARRGSDFKNYLQPETFTVHLWNHSWKQERDYLHDKNFRMALKQYFQRCLVDPKSMWGDSFPLDFIKYYLAHQLGSVYRFYSRQKNRLIEKDHR